MKSFCNILFQPFFLKWKKIREKLSIMPVPFILVASIIFSPAFGPLGSHVWLLPADPRTLFFIIFFDPIYHLELLIHFLRIKIETNLFSRITVSWSFARSSTAFFIPQSQIHGFPCKLNHFKNSFQNWSTFGSQENCWISKSGSNFSSEWIKKLLEYFLKWSLKSLSHQEDLFSPILFEIFSAKNVIGRQFWLVEWSDWSR